MGIYRGAGGSGDAINDSSSEALITIQARDAALAAQAAAEAAQAAAELAETNAETAETNAETAETNAETAATNAASSASAASTSASNASTSASNAASSASAASTSASNASTSATNASNSASAASTSATNAANSASAASTSATNANNSASAAATSETNAAASYDSFDDRYLGAKSSAPSVDNDGNTLLIGALYFNTTTNEMKVWSGSAWLNAYASLSGALLATNNLSDLNNTATARTNLGVAIGVNVQAYDQQLADVAGLTPSDNNFIVGNGTNFVTESGSTARTSLGLGSIATQDSSNVTITGGSINGTTVGATTASTGKFTTLEATGVTTVQAGTVSAPAITTSGDTNTGIFFPAADTIAFTEGGVESMRIDSSGNVGIGTSSTATWKLLVASGSAYVSTLYQTGSVSHGNKDAVIAFYDGTYYNNASYWAHTHVWNINGGGTEGMRITSAGNVGIGTSSPGAKLQIGSATYAPNGNLSNNLLQIKSSSGFAYLTIGNGDGANNTSYIGSASSITVFGSVTDAGVATERMRITSTGTVAIGTTTTPTAKLWVESGRVGLTNTFKLGWHSNPAHGDLSNYITGDDNSNYVALGTNAAERMRIDSSGNVGIGTSSPSAQLQLNKSGTGDYSTIRLSNSGTSGRTYEIGLGGNTAAAGFANNLYFYDSTASATRMVIDSSGNVGINTTTPNKNTLNKALTISSTTGYAGFEIAVANTITADFITNASNAFLTTRTAIPLVFQTNDAERMRITSAGAVAIGKTDTSLSVAGIAFLSDGRSQLTVDNNEVMNVNRLTSDGNLIRFYQAGTEEGNISVSGTTVSYNGGHLSRSAQTIAPKDESIVKGTVLSNLDDMNVYVDEEGNVVDNEQLNKVKVSDVEGDVNVAGVFVNWSHDEAHNVDEINMAMTGDMIIRIAQDVVVQKGDLLMSAGDGTAKPQGDDIVRSKTIAKVTSNYVTCTYADGSYCVPCVLMAC
jgi:hypothetical protein